MAFQKIHIFHFEKRLPRVYRRTLTVFFQKTYLSLPKV
jgi:hypothetical protein